MKHKITVGAAASILSVVLMCAPLPAARAVDSVEDLRDAMVPSMCEHPAGHLVDGSLPGLEVGNVDLTAATVAPLIKGGEKEAAATFACSQGGIGWPDHVVFYDSAENVIGHLDAGTIGDSGGRQHVEKVSISKRTASIRLIAVPLSGDNNLWGSAGAKVTYRWDAAAGAMTQRTAKIYVERPTARKLVRAARAGNVKAARRYATARVAREMITAARATKRQGGTVRLLGCYGTYAWDDFIGFETGLVEFGERGCLVEHRFAEGYFWDLAVFRHPRGDLNWSHWKAVKLVPIWD